tara:strand:+ start:185 stop:559 length:375 start_codon:yes stop_codon:yes gene_type:complete
MTAKRITPNQKRALRTRSKIKKAAIRNGRARLTIYRSNNHISAQIIDDAQHVTLASASTIDKDLKGKLKDKTSNSDAATQVGKLLAERAKKAGVKEVVFDRGRYVYHGRIKALADAAREGGLEF